MPTPSLEMKIGQMIMVGFRGLSVSDESTIIRNIRDEHVGSVVLFDQDVALGSGRRNIRSPQQLKQLTDALQAAARTPLLISTDQEGGRVNRLKPQYGFAPTVSAAYLGVMNDLELTHNTGISTGQMLAEHGVNLNLAPVVDLNVNPNNPVIGRVERSFGRDPQSVILHATTMVRAQRQSGVLTTLKHFPGHGSSRGDTHLGFVDVTDTWLPEELDPYRIMVENDDVDAVMTAHIFNSKLDPDLPATLSRPIITGLLREALGYDGVIISDDMQMRAISDHYPFDQAVQLAVKAGVDIIAVSNNIRFAENVAARAIGAIRALLESGEIDEARIDQSYRRIMRLKARLA